MKAHLISRNDCAIHGDLHVGNVLRLDDGRLGLLDWDEARRDQAAIDQIAVGIPHLAPEYLHFAAECAASWHREPARGRNFARRLVFGPKSGRQLALLPPRPNTY